MTIASCSETKLEHINPDDLLTHKSFSQVVKVNEGKLVFVSGQVAFDKNGKVQGEDFESQFRHSLMNVHTALKSVGSDWQNVVRMKIYIVNLKPEHRFVIGMVLDELYEKSAPPANTLIGIQSLARKDLKVEIEVDAVAN